MYKWPLMKDTITFNERFNIAKFALTTSKFTKGEQCLAFEKEWSQWLGAKESIFVSSGSTANFLLLAAVMEKYGIKPGDKILLPACTWMTNVAPAIQLGLQPIFADINLENFSFDTKTIEKISIDHKDIKIVFVTHLLGFPAQKNIIEHLFPQAIIIDDVCESHGCTDGPERVGANSLGATFSFYFGHHMTTIEGGMISTVDEDLADLMRMKRSHGMARESKNFLQYHQNHKDLSSDFLFITDGYNFRNHEIPAVIGRSQLKKLNNSIRIRKENYALFKDIINNNTHKFYPAYDNPGNSSFCFPIISRDRDTKERLLHLFHHNGIESRPVVGGNLLRQPFLSGHELYSIHEKPNADIVNDMGIYIGNNQFVNKEDISWLEEIINDC